MSASNTPSKASSAGASSVTNDDAIIRSLGINPSNATNYSDVSLEPVSFTHVESLGWGDVYQAVHSVTWDLWKDSERGQITVDGLTVNVAKGEPEEFEDLLFKWRLALDATS